MRILKTKIIYTSSHPYDLENEINKFLEDKDAFDIKDIKIQDSKTVTNSGYGDNSSYYIICLITYYLPIDKKTRRNK